MDLDEVAGAIRAKHLRWEATEATRLFPDRGGSRFGLKSSGLDAPALQVASGGIPDPLDRPPPSKFNWRGLGKVTAAKDQGTCGSCVAFATCGAVESALLISQDKRVGLSEAHLFFCGVGPDACEQGWDFLPALDRAQSVGIGAEADLPYSPNGSCLEIDPIARVTNYTVVFSARDRRKLIATTGPVIGGMKVYEDLANYKSGIYEHAVGRFVDLHAVLIVGYDDEENCWIVKNSWGADWGEEGFFKIAYGQASIEAYPFIGVEAALV